MKKHQRMQKKYFFRQLSRYLFIFTLPIFLLGCLLTIYNKNRLEKELAIYADRSRNYVLYNVTNVLESFANETALFSSSPTVALSMSKLLNQESLDYRNSVYKSIVPTLISTASHLNRFVESVYVYYDNPYGKYFSSLKQYTGIDTPDSTDREWLTLYENTPGHLKRWVVTREVKNYTFEPPRDTITVFRRFDYADGVIVVNLNMTKVSEMMESLQIYPGSCTLITDDMGNVLFGSSGFRVSDTGELKENMIKLTGNQASYKIATFRSTENTYIKYIYYTSSIPEYNLEMISMLPMAEVFQPVHTLILAFAIMILFSICLSISLSWSVTSGNFRQLYHLLDLFQRTEKEEKLPEERRPESQNEYDIIFNNIIQTFVSNNLLKLHLTQAKVQQKDAKLAALQLQLNPHFIFNTLQTIDMEILKLHAAENHSSLLIHHLSDILKYSLENTSRDVTIGEEIQICKTYAEIQKRRYQNPFILYWDYDEEILGKEMIHLVLQPLLENSLHHGIKEAGRKGLVKIKIFKRNERIHIYIADNGVGIDSVRISEIRNNLICHEFGHTSHIGIYNTNLRLFLTYGSESEIEIRSKINWGTIVHFSIPFTVEKESL